MKTIHKFQIEVVDSQVIKMPKGAKILCVQLQHGFPCLWALVIDTEPLEYRKIYVSRTGHQIVYVGNYVGTFQLHDGSLIFHVFEGEA